MKVLLVCGAGMSTSILMKKMQRYAAEKGIELAIEARGADAAAEAAAGVDCVLVGPQIAYRAAAVAAECGKPCAVIAPADYGIGNCAAIFEQINGLIGR